MLGPESVSKLHQIILEIKGVLLNVLLFFRFCRTEIKSILRTWRPRSRVKQPVD